MSDPTQPKDPASTQAESPTRNFSLKLDGWMTELAKDFAPADESAPEAAPSPAAASVPAAPIEDDPTPVDPPKV